MRNPFKRTPAALARKRMMNAIRSSLNHDLEGIVIGFTTSPDSKKVDVILAMNGKPNDVGIQFAETMRRLMKRDDVGVMLADSLSAALHYHRPEMMKDPLEMLLEKLGATVELAGCGDPSCPYCSTSPTAKTH